MNKFKFGDKIFSSEFHTKGKYGVVIGHKDCFNLIKFEDYEELYLFTDNYLIKATTELLESKRIKDIANLIFTNQEAFKEILIDVSFQEYKNTDNVKELIANIQKILDAI